MKILGLLIIPALLAPAVVHAGNQAPCVGRNPAEEPRSPHRLRAIAETCAYHPVAELYYHRAHHAELI
jgi:hypothetical protein